MTENIISLDSVKEIIEQGDFDKLESAVLNLDKIANDIASKSQGGRLTSEAYSQALDVDEILRHVSHVSVLAAIEDERYAKIFNSCQNALGLLRSAFNRESNFYRL